MCGNGIPRRPPRVQSAIARPRCHGAPCCIESQTQVQRQPSSRPPRRTAAGALKLFVSTALDAAPRAGGGFAQHGGADRAAGAAAGVRGVVDGAAPAPRRRRRAQPQRRRCAGDDSPPTLVTSPETPPVPRDASRPPTCVMPSRPPTRPAHRRIPRPCCDKSWRGPLLPPFLL